jgi:cysteine desulfurase family protein (TIGR01976 family)
MTYDVAAVRGSFPALDDGTAYFDSPGGTQVPRQVATAVAETLCAGISNRGSVTAAERRADAVVTRARTAVADLLGCDAGGVVFGRSMTTLTYDIARALAKEWQFGDEVVVTRLDHDANVRPWIAAARDAGATVRWVDFDRESAELPVGAVKAQLSSRTRVVAITGASNLFGTRPDVSAITEAAHRFGALVYVDGVHLTPHSPIDVTELGADFYACSPYKFFGPHHGVLMAAPDLLERVHPDKLLPSTDAVPERFEMGTLPYELLAGTAAAVDFLADMASSAGDRRSRVLESMAAAEAHEHTLFERLVEGLRSIDAVTLHGAPGRRTPTALFSVAGHAPSEVHAHLALHGVNAPAGSFYAIEAARWFGLGDAGAVRAGISSYTNADDVDRLVAGVAGMTR